MERKPVIVRNAEKPSWVTQLQRRVTKRTEEKSCDTAESGKGFGHPSFFHIRERTHWTKPLKCKLELAHTITCEDSPGKEIEVEVM